MASQLTTGSDLKLDKAAKFVGNIAAYVSLCCSASMWVDGGVFYFFHFSWSNRLTGLHFFKIMGVGLVLSMISAACRAKLALVAFPVAVLMFFFVMYVMGA